MDVPEIDLNQWLSAVIWRWTQQDIDMEGVRSELFDLVRLPVDVEDLEALNVCFDVLFLRFEAGQANVEQTVTAFIQLIESLKQPRVR